MDRFLSFLSLLALSVTVSHAASPPQDYWKTVLPNTPMPRAIKDLLSSDALVDEKAGTTVNVGKGGVNVSTGEGKSGGTSVNVGHKGVGVNVGGQPGTEVGVGGGGVHDSTGKVTNENVSHVGVNVNVGHGKPVVVNVKPGYNTFNYLYAASDTQLHDDPRVALFFLEKDLHPGAKMTLHFTKTTSGAAFIPRREANSIPFSSTKLPEILNRFSIQPNSLEAETMKKTLEECELPTVDGEIKHCTTSLESMVDFSTSNLGTRDVKAVSTTVEKEGEAEQEYSIEASGVKRMEGKKLVACHAENYAYAVFYCHVTRKSRAYTVKMVGRDGAAVEAVAVCHTDTAGWNPKHLAFRVLGVKPGTVPVCHFLPQDHIVWGPKN